MVSCEHVIGSACDFTIFHLNFNKRYPMNVVGAVASCLVRSVISGSRDLGSSPNRKDKKDTLLTQCLSPPRCVNWPALSYSHLSCSLSHKISEFQMREMRSRRSG